jgi:Transcriptional regulator, AbiEi antitoxin
MTDLLPERLTQSVFLRREALAAGVSHAAIAAAVRSGDWVRLRHGAYTSGDAFRSATEEERHALVARAVVMQAKTDVVLSHISAVPEYGGPLWGVSTADVHITRLDQRAGRREAGVRQHQGALEEPDIVTRNGLLVTSPERTLIDVSTCAPLAAAVAVANYLLHHRLTSMTAVHERYESMQHHPFTLKTDLVLRLADPRIESVGETRTFVTCWQQGIPAPEPQWVVLDEAGREFARLDFAWPDRKSWLEFDGREKYTKFLRPGESVVDAVLREKKRESRICELTGWRCLRITWAELADPVRLGARIAAFLRLRT